MLYRRSRFWNETDNSNQFTTGCKRTQNGLRVFLAESQQRIYFVRRGSAPFLG